VHRFWGLSGFEGRGMFRIAEPTRLRREDAPLTLALSTEYGGRGYRSARTLRSREYGGRGYAAAADFIVLLNSSAWSAGVEGRVCGSGDAGEVAAIAAEDDQAAQGIDAGP